MRERILRARVPALLAICAALSAPAPARSGAAAPDVRILETPAIVQLAVGDLDGEGIADVAAAEATYPRGEQPVFRLHLFFQKDGMLSALPDRSFDLSARASGLLVGDYNGDGRNDLVVGLRPRRSIAIYTGASGFEDPIVAAYGNDSGAACLSAGRLNDRGVADFLTGAAWRKWIDGGNAFANAYFSGVERNDHRFSRLADLDYSGSDDVVFTTFILENPPEKNNLIRILYGPFLVSGGIIPPTHASEIVTLTSPLAGEESERPLLGPIFIGDLNGNGRPDILTSGRGDTFIYFQNSPTGFTEGAGPSLVLEGVTPLLVENLGGDGFCDLVLRGSDGKLFLWRQSQGRPLTGDWKAQALVISLPRAAQAVAAGDVTGDGKKELVVAMNRSGLAIVPMTNNDGKE